MSCPRVLHFRKTSAKPKSENAEIKASMVEFKSEPEPSPSLQMESKKVSQTELKVESGDNKADETEN